MKMFTIVLVTIIVTISTSLGISWNGNWALGCDFSGNDLTNARIRGEDCGGRCASTSGCTHFTWTDYNGGTCWMKQNSVSKNDAFQSHDKSAVCGVNNNGNSALPAGIFNTRNGAYSETSIYTNVHYVWSNSR